MKRMSSFTSTSCPTVTAVCPTAPPELVVVLDIEDVLLLLLLVLRALSELPVSLLSSPECEGLRAAKTSARGVRRLLRGAIRRTSPRTLR